MESEVVNPNPLHPDDLAYVTGPVSAFQRGAEHTPTVYAQQHHLALEVVAHLREHGVPFVFRGGTALHTKLADRRRFSIDVDITTVDRAAIHECLKQFPKRFPNSAVELLEPPRDLRVEGVAHELVFRHASPEIRLLVEVVEASEPPDGLEQTRLVEGPLDWGIEVPTPTLSAFVGQKLAVLGPNTIGKPVGRNDPYARSNQGVCKQIFDLRELLGRPDLEPAAIIRAYDVAVEEANRLRDTAHSKAACLTDARDLLAHLRLRKLKGSEKEPEARYGLWAGYEDSKRWIVARAAWKDTDYRIAAGVITRLAIQLEAGDLRLEQVRAPLAADVPEAVRQKLSAAETNGEGWFTSGQFDGLARLAWAWAPPELW